MTPFTSTGTTYRAELADRPVAEAVTRRGRELSADATVGDARRAFAASRSVQLLPLLDGTAYVGAVERDDLDPDAPDTDPLLPYAIARPPVAIAGQRLSAALQALDEDGGERLVVLAADRTTFVGLVCLRPDRERLCVDAECHSQPLAGKDFPDMTAIAADARVADLVIADPSSARVFDEYGIDYCCGGQTRLRDACAARGLDPADLLAALRQPRAAEPDDIDWGERSLTALVDHIVATHHDYLREELPHLRQLVARVAGRHGAAHAELDEVQAVYGALERELARHLAEEELVVFPACLQLEHGDTARAPIDEPIAAMLHDHDDVAAALRRLRELTLGYQPPADACTSYRAMLQRLEALERDTHRHVHEENNILFPRAAALAA